ncbi:MAG TPA: GNAT family N-acetyltransferase [Polyangiaceae bacterium]
MLLRAATPSDREPVTEFVFAALRAHGIEPDDTDRDVTELGAHPECDELVAEVEGIVVGVVLVEPLGDHEGWISKLFVTEAARGRGVGRALLAAAVARARERGWTALGLRTRTVFHAAISLYESTGWTHEEDPPSRGVGEDRVYRLAL